MIQEELDALVNSLPDVIGAVVCDQDGEAIATTRGRAPLPPGADAEARRRLPRALTTGVDVEVMALRLAAAEPLSLLRALSARARAAGAGEALGFEVRHGAIHVLVSALVEECYVVLLVRSGPRVAEVRAKLDRARRGLASLL